MEFKKESYLLFDQMVDSIYDDIVNYLMRIAKIVPEKEEREAKKIYASLNFVHNNVSAVDESNDGGEAKSKNIAKQSTKIKKRYKVKK
jgi:preprotein translocase subunit SecA